MHIAETVLIFAGIPAAVVAVITGAVYAGSARRSRRYRPGRPFEFTPVWFLAAPETSGPGARPHTAAIEAAPAPAAAALPSGGGGPVSGPHGDEWPAAGQGKQDVTGGASDRW